MFAGPCRLVTLILFVFVTAKGTCAAEGDGLPSLPSPEILEEQGAIIGEITIVNGDVFDTSIESESGWLYRAANKLHINTRPDVIRDQLLFRSGEPYRKRVIEETERILRANDYMYDAKISPIAFRDGVVDLEVRTRDVWTLNPGFNFNRKGGENSFGAQIEEDNLLGTGQQLELEWDSDVDRESLIFSYFDPHFLHSWNRLGFTYADADDGDTKAFRFDRPFYSLDARWSAGTNLYDSLRNDQRYALGKKVGEFQHSDEYYEVSGGWSAGLQGKWVRRWTYGATYERDEFAVLPDEPLGGPLPGDREFAYPWIGFDLVEDNFQERRNLNQIRRTEDVLIGLRLGGRLGYAAEDLGSDRDAAIFSAYVQDGTDFDGADQTVFGTATVYGRVEDEGLRNAVLSAEARYYWQTSSRSKFYALVSGAVGEDLDADNQLLLGGDNGLRGYPLRYQGGTARALLTLEQRYYTDWYPFRLFYVGAAAFFDMGRTWGTDVTGMENLGLLKDIGIGLRLGSSRSSFGNVVHIDLAFPLDGNGDIDNVQLLVETKGSF
jgi:outer membrane protein assembly factor BamA